MTESNKSLNQIIKFRLDKLNKIYDHGVDPYPQKFEPKHNNNEIVCDFLNFDDSYDFDDFEDLGYFFN